MDFPFLFSFCSFASLIFYFNAMNNTISISFFFQNWLRCIFFFSQTLWLSCFYRNGSWFSCWTRAHSGCTEQPGAWQLNNQSTCHQCTKRSQSTNSWGESIVDFVYLFVCCVVVSPDNTRLSIYTLSWKWTVFEYALSDLEMFVKWPSKRMYGQLIENVMNHSDWVERFRNCQLKPGKALWANMEIEEEKTNTSENNTILELMRCLTRNRKIDW